MGERSAAQPSRRLCSPAAEGLLPPTLCSAPVCPGGERGSPHPIVAADPPRELAQLSPSLPPGLTAMAPTNSSRNFTAPEARNGSGEQGLARGRGASPRRGAGAGAGAWGALRGKARLHIALALFCSAEPGRYPMKWERLRAGAQPPPQPPTPGVPAGTSRLQHPRADSSGPRAGRHTAGRTGSTPAGGWGGAPRPRPPSRDTVQHQNKARPPPLGPGA